MAISYLLDIFGLNSAVSVGNPKAAAYLLGQLVRDFGVSRYGFDRAGERVAPKRMARAFPLQIAAMPAKMAQ
jgi:hypothetical protein